VTQCRTARDGHESYDPGGGKTPMDLMAFGAVLLVALMAVAAGIYVMKSISK